MKFLDIPKIFNMTIECESGETKTNVYIGWMCIVQDLQNFIPQACKHAEYTNSAKIKFSYPPQIQSFCTFSENECFATTKIFDVCNQDLHNQIHAVDRTFAKEFAAFVKALVILKIFKNLKYVC
jgi:hypothetical protein